MRQRKVATWNANYGIKERNDAKIDIDQLMVNLSDGSCRWQVCVEDAEEDK